MLAAVDLRQIRSGEKWLPEGGPQLNVYPEARAFMASQPRKKPGVQIQHFQSHSISTFTKVANNSHLLVSMAITLPMPMLVAREWLTIEKRSNKNPGA
jgi:hypothetical protein